jgi:fumarate reductase subunit C
MNAPTEYLPKSYRPVVSTYWWLAKWPYLKFMLRELTCVFVAWFVILTLLQVSALSRGAADYAQFQDWLKNPFVILLNAVSFLFVVFHAVTWFNLAPKAMAVRMGGKRVPDALIAGPNYVAWLVVSAAVAWIVLRG